MFRPSQHRPHRLRISSPAALTSCQQEAENMENISQSIETICEMQSASVRRGRNDGLGSTSFDQ